MTSDNETFLSVSDQSLKPRRPKSREVSSRYLSPISSPTLVGGIPSPNQAHSPLHRKSTTTDARKHRSLEDSGFGRGLWPSSAASSASQMSNKNLGTLADHLGNERLRDFLERKLDDKFSSNNVFSLSRQRSCSEYGRFETEKQSAKENHRPFLGGSMRYTGKIGFSGKSSTSSSSSSSNSSSNGSGIVPRRLSVDETALYSRSSRQKSDPLVESIDSESEFSDMCGSASDFNSLSVGKNSSIGSRKYGIEVSSKYMYDIPSRPRRSCTSDSSIEHPVSLDSSPKIKKFTIKNAIKRANSLTGYGSATSQWALSPGRSGSPPMSVENKERPMSFSSLKPPSSPSRVKGVEKLLHLGLDLFKGKKFSSPTSLLGSGNSETFHQLRLLHNRLMQWRYSNARAHTVNGNKNVQVETNLLHAWDSLTKLRHSVVHKKLQLQKEKLKMKLDFIVQSQIKLLEAWGDLEWQHLSAVSKTKESLHSVVCRIPLIEGAKVEPQLTSVAIRHASDLTASIRSTLCTFSPSAEKIVSLLAELADVITQEKLLIEECFELFHTMSMLEIKARSLNCFIIQSNCWKQLQQQQQ